MENSFAGEVRIYTSQGYALITVKANNILSCITKSVTSRLKEEITPLSSAHVRNVWNTVQFWDPQKKDIEILEWVQQRATKMCRGMKHMTYEERLTEVNLNHTIES